MKMKRQDSVYIEGFVNSVPVHVQLIQLPLIQLCLQRFISAYPMSRGLNLNLFQRGRLLPLMVLH